MLGSGCRLQRAGKVDVVDPTKVGGEEAGSSVEASALLLLRAQANGQELVAGRSEIVKGSSRQAIEGEQQTSLAWRKRSFETRPQCYRDRR